MDTYQLDGYTITIKHWSVFSWTVLGASRTVLGTFRIAWKSQVSQTKVLTSFDDVMSHREGAKRLWKIYVLAMISVWDLFQSRDLPSVRTFWGLLIVWIGRLLWSVCCWRPFSKTPTQQWKHFHLEIWEFSFESNDIDTADATITDENWWLTMVFI